MTQNVVLVVKTKAQDFPVDTVDSLFTYTIKDAGGAPVVSKDSADPSATFEAVADGDYTAEVTKNGVTVSQAFTVKTSPTTVSLQVPDTLVISFS